MEYRGIDVSKYQGGINFKKIKNVDFAIIRIGYGKYESQKDQFFEANYEGFKNLNIPVGVYLYSYAKNASEAREEALTALKWLNNRHLDLPVYFDIEDKSQLNLGKNVLTSMCESFCQTIEKAGYWSGIYANKYFFTTYLDYVKLGEKYTCWVAQYNETNTYSGKYDMWQYSSSGKVGGINGNVDMNILYRDIFINKEKHDLPDLANYSGSSIVDALDGVHYDSSFDSREKLYKMVGYNDVYKGTSIQNENLLKVLQNKTSGSFYTSNYNGFSLVDALKEINVDSSFTNRKKIAIKNGINNYKGSVFQNLKLLNLLKKGELKK